jgi:hypothetical protein
LIPPNLTPNAEADPHSRTNRTAINKVGRLVLYLLLLVGLVEAASWATIQFYNWAVLPNYNNEVVREPDPDGEVYAVMSNSILFPTRWYMFQPNFRGRYVVTDDAGFRIDPTAVTEAKSIGFFGGSIMFSIVTRQEHSIPALVHLPGFNSLNFGVNGSTATELPTLLEALRRYRLEAAVFYDGVNEIGRYLEMLQDGAPEAFAAVGYYYRGTSMLRSRPISAGTKRASSSRRPQCGSPSGRG